MNKIIKDFCVTICENIFRLTDESIVHHWSINDAIFMYKSAHFCNVLQWNNTADYIVDSFLDNYECTPDKSLKELADLSTHIHELLINDYSKGDADEVMETLDQSVIKKTTKDCQYEDITPYVYQLLYFSNRNLDSHSSMIYEAIIKETLFFVLNNCSKVKTEFLYSIIRDTTCDRYDLTFLYLDILTTIGRDPIFKEKIYNILREYDSVLVSLIPQLCYNKLRYISILSQIFELTCSNNLKLHINAIASTLDKDEITRNFKTKDLRCHEGFIYRWHLLQNACKIGELSGGTIKMLKECLNEKTQDIQKVIEHLNVESKKDGEQNKIMRIKEYTKLGNELLLLCT